MDGFCLKDHSPLRILPRPRVANVENDSHYHLQLLPEVRIAALVCRAPPRNLSATSQENLNDPAKRRVSLALSGSVYFCTVKAEKFGVGSEQTATTNTRNT